MVIIVIICATYIYLNKTKPELIPTARGTEKGMRLDNRSISRIISVANSTVVFSGSFKF